MEKFTKNSKFQTLKIRQNSNFQLFSIFSFAKSSWYNILSIRKNRIHLSWFLLFNIAKTAENCTFRGKNRELGEIEVI